MYYRRPRRRRANSYLMPFVVIIVIFVTLFFGWKSVNKSIINQSSRTLSEKVFLSIDSGSAKAMTVGEQEWQNAPDKIYLYKGEKVKTGSDGRASLTFFDGSEVRLNTSSEIEFTALKKRNETNTVASQINSGEVWINTKRITNPDSSFKMSTSLFDLETRGATYAIEYPGTVYVLNGNVQVDIKYKGVSVESYNVGVGQQLVVDEQKAESVKKGEDAEIIFALSESFERSNWYEWNQMKENGELVPTTNEENSTDENELSDEETTTKDEEAPEDDEEPSGLNSETLTITKPENNSATNISLVTVAGRSNDKVSSVEVNGKAVSPSANKWQTTIELSQEGDNNIKIEAMSTEGEVMASETLSIDYDKEAPEKPVVTSPNLDEENSYTLDDIEQTIEGTVSKDTQAVIVNDYRLTQYVPGSKEFKYFAKTSYNNLKVGENEYEIIAEDKAGNQSEPTVIYLELKAETIEELADDKNTTNDSESATTSAPADSSSGGVEFTAPNGGESFHTNETEFELKGVVPAKSTKVSVNDYELTQFTEGDTTFTYRAYVSIGNLKIGEKNTYTVKAFDADGKVLGQASMTIDVESGVNAAPEINIPSADSQYTTSLDTVVIGGKIGKWVTRVYINEKEITDYIPGSETFRTSVNLKEGENNFTIKAEKSGEAAGEDSINIIYQP